MLGFFFWLLGRGKELNQSEENGGSGKKKSKKKGKAKGTKVS